MANGVEVRQWGIIVGIVATLLTTGGSYGHLKSVAGENTKKAENNSKDIKQLALKIEDKIDSQNDKITKILVAVEQIKAKVD